MNETIDLNEIVSLLKTNIDKMNENGIIRINYNDGIFGACTLICTFEMLQDMEMYSKIMWAPKTNAPTIEEINSWKEAEIWLDRHFQDRKNWKGIYEKIEIRTHNPYTCTCGGGLGILQPLCNNEYRRLGIYEYVPMKENE